MRMYTIYIDMSIGMYTYIKRCMHIYVHKRIYTCTCMYIYMDLGGYACAHVCILTCTYICILPLGDSRKAMNGCLGLTRDIYSNMYDTLTFEGITSSNPDYCVARLLCRWPWSFIVWTILMFTEHCQVALRSFACMMQLFWCIIMYNCLRICIYCTSYSECIIW